MFGVTLVLLLAGIMTATGIVASRLARQVQQSAGVTLTIANGVTPSELDSVADAIEDMPQVAGTTVVTRSDALQQWKEETGEDLVELLGENPLNASIQVYVGPQWAQGDSLMAVKMQLEQIPGVVDAATTDRKVDNIVETARRLQLTLAVMALVLLVIAVALITGLVRLLVHSQRFHIHTMSLVGATSWFIVRPFVLRGAVMGMASGLVATVLLGAVAGGMASSRDPLYQALMQSLGTGGMAAVAAVMAVAGIVVTAAAAGMAARRMVLSSEDELYERN